MIITFEAAPVDDRGRLLHAEDPLAQTCLAFVRLESELAGHGLSTADITTLWVLSADARPDPDLLAVLAERFGPAAPPMRLTVVGDLGRPGMTIGLRADVDAD